MVEKFPTESAEDRAFDAALGRTVAAYREAVGMSRERLVANMPITAGHLLAFERGNAGLTLSRVVALAEQTDADPLDLILEALVASRRLHHLPGATTRLVHAIHHMHPTKREHVAEIVAVMG